MEVWFGGSRPKVHGEIAPAVLKLHPPTYLHTYTRYFLSGTETYLVAKVEEASLLVPTEFGKGGRIFIRTRFQTQPPGRTVYAHLCKLILLAAGRRRGLWFQSSFVIWRPPRGVKRKWRDDESCANFRREEESGEPSTPPNSWRIHSPSFPPHTASPQAALARKPIAFIETKNPQTHPEASLLVPTELGKGGQIFIRTRFQTQPPDRTIYAHLCKLILLAAGRRRGLWFQTSFGTKPGRSKLMTHFKEHNSNQLFQSDFIPECFATMRILSPLHVLYFRLLWTKHQKISCLYNWNKSMTCSVTTMDERWHEYISECRKWSFGQC